jgi:diguanylate cyclase (GGDEF)-like protein
VIFVTSHAEAEFEVAGFELGAADFIAKPVSPPLVLARVKAQLRFKHMADEMRRIAMVDGLSGVANRRCFDETFSREWQRSRRRAQPISLLFVDIDHFKQFNDHYGHPAGDACLRAVAQALVIAGLRPADQVARYGGEEFVVLLPETARAGAEHMAHRVLDAIEALAIPHRASATALHVTVSVGVACYDHDSNGWIEASADSRFLSTQHAHVSAGELLVAADNALYAAKHAGRAQARLLDIADFDAPAMVREIAPANRPQRATVRTGTIAP